MFTPTALLYLTLVVAVTYWVVVSIREHPDAAPYEGDDA